MITDALLAYRHELRQDIIEDQTDDFSTFLGHLADQLIFNAFTQEAVRRRSQGKPEDNAPIVEVICMCCVCPNDNSVEFLIISLSCTIIRLFVLIVQRSLAHCQATSLKIN